MTNHPRPLNPINTITSVIIQHLEHKTSLLLMLPISSIITDGVALFRERAEADTHPDQLIVFPERNEDEHSLLKCLWQMIPGLD
jgi:hypothetical protein